MGVYAMTALSKLWHIYPWSIAFLILFIAMGAGFLRTEQVADDHLADVAKQQQRELARDLQFCTAIPAAATAAARALTIVTIRDSIDRRDTLVDRQKVREMGIFYTTEARRLVLEDLPECQKILP